ncbi:retrovirus-related Pol polyprotein from type-1 retrotransposable element R2 [Trichonephila clavata]|uniref:Retrovirus-related Pol polyprotein from type-1 retrotransposable element R2 n=1 Tax=Trichonephila clavata TaxID=2740835 RepID=A0A8X6GG10_TRICU|nr:retrovirus-related Pol polyprotein from type-1 retrotransposable element R2 [Trichonephila clavata]
MRWHKKELPSPKTRVFRAKTSTAIQRTRVFTQSGSSASTALQVNDRGTVRSPTHADDSSVTPTCVKCGATTRTRKGMTYHMLQVHGVPVHKKQGPDSSRPDRGNAPLEDRTPAQVSRHTCSASELEPGVSLIGETLRYTFPIPFVIACPVENCTHTFATRAWFNTNHSLKRHMTAVHRMPNRSVEYWCSICRMRITKNPAGHACLMSAGLTQHSASVGGWPCDSSEDTSRDNDGPRGRIDVQQPELLLSFNEPLDTLLEVEDLEDRKSHFEAIVEGITTSVQQNFNLSEPAPRTGSNSTNNGCLDTRDPQKVQKMYRWNRRKCIRALTQAASNRCPVSMQDTTSHFKNVWEEVSSPAERPLPEPPTRPPIVESFSQSFVASCLQSAENSAPGPDMISYRHWREVDPACLVLTKVFNVCLRFSDIPTCWKKSKTILIHKKGDPGDLNNWRPIALSDTIYKLFSKCLTKKDR